MSKIDDRTRLLHMRDAAREISIFIQGKTKESLETDRMLTLSLVKLVEIIGEAASRVSRNKQAEIKTIPWAQIIGMRNRLIHGYYEIDLDIVWKTIAEDLEPLLALLEDAIAREEESEK
ncbi:DUF86 domain-containing protein [Spirulina sp. 06S082]|uniref:HepT-like ribonuclease domain-containing protein n=1 Tax=Spirulina sp. 06S082 TaxID=3110248 RepID=UPI002B1F0095|nr:HepT-like ribonuclease domain-containing protein [Spirulina sp. 06S082]MEA5469853.1 HepT-like ribonuclease domain-containing protein [Spirulina sp. 06S082]